MAAKPRRRPAMAALLLGAAAIAVVIVGVTSVGSTPARTVNQQLVTAKRGVVQKTVSGSGTLSPAKQADVNFGTSGTISAIHVKVGQHVSAGDVLANLDSSAAEVQVATAKASLQSAEDDLTTAETASSSSTSTSTAAGGTAGATKSVAAAQAAVDSAQLTLKNAETALADTALHAPIGGTVASIDGAVGDTAGGGGSSSASGSSSGSTASSGSASTSSSSSSAFIVLAQVRHFKMDVSLTESDIGSVKVGQRATVTVNAADGQQFSAHVSAIGVLASSNSSSGSGSTSSAVSYPVTLTLDQTGGKLKPGMSASADIITRQQSGISVPTAAIQGSTVTVVRNGKHVTQQVETGIAGNSNTIITSGVKAGEQIVVTSVSAAAGAAASGVGANANGAAGRFGNGAGIGGALGGAGGGAAGGGFRGGGFGGGPPGGG